MTDAARDPVDGPGEGWLSRVVVAWVDAVRRRAGAVLLATLASTALLLVYAATHISINTSHTALLSDDLPFWRAYMEYAEVFPILDEALLVVVDAETPARARDAADDLADRLRAMPERFDDVFVPGGGAFFQQHALLYLSVDELYDLSDRMATLQPILSELARDRSLRHLAELIQLGIERERRGEVGGADLGPVFDSISSAARRVLEGRPRPVAWTDLIARTSGDDAVSRRLVVLHPVLDYDRLLPALRPMQTVDEAVAALGLEADGDVRVRITGNVALNTEEMITVARQTVLAAAGSLAVVGIILFSALRSAHLVAAILASLVVGLVWTGAFAAFAVGSLNVVSISFAVLFIGLGVDFGIHLAMRYAELVREGEEHARALERTAAGVGGSLVLCSITTAFGFFVFVPTDYRAVAELGLISGTGMIISLFCSLTVLPALLTRSQGRPVGREWAGSAVFERVLSNLALGHPVRVLVAAGVLGAAALAVLPEVRFDHNVVAMRDPSTESAETFAELLSDSATSPWSIDLIAADLAEADRTARRLAELEFVESAVTLRDYVPDEQEEKLEVLEELLLFVPEPTSMAGAAAPAELVDQITALTALQESLDAFGIADGDSDRAQSARRAGAELARFLARLEGLERKRPAVDALERSLTGELPAQMFALWDALSPGPIELANLPPDLARRMLAADGRARVQVLPSRDLGDNTEHARFVDGVRQLHPDATGSAVSLLEWGRAVVRTFQQALLSAVCVVAFALWMLWRRPGDMGMVLGPLLLAAAATAALAAACGIAFNFANVVVLPLLLGIGVDSGVHMVHRFREVREQSEAGDAGTGHALLGTSTAQAVLFSALTTLSSFGTLALSSHVGFASLGRLLVVGIVLTLAANLVLLPALITVRDRRSTRGAE